MCIFGVNSDVEKFLSKILYIGQPVNRLNGLRHGHKQRQTRTLSHKLMDVQGIVVQFSKRIMDLCSVHIVLSIRSSTSGEKHRILYSVCGVHITSLLSGRRECKNGHL